MFFLCCKSTDNWRSPSVCSFCCKFAKLCGAPGFGLDNCFCFYIELAYSNFTFVAPTHSSWLHNFSKNEHTLDCWICKTSDMLESGIYLLTKIFSLFLEFYLQFWMILVNIPLECGKPVDVPSSWEKYWILSEYN